MKTYALFGLSLFLVTSGMNTVLKAGEYLTSTVKTSSIHSIQRTQSTSRPFIFSGDELVAASPKTIIREIKMLIQQKIKKHAV